MIKSTEKHNIGWTPIIVLSIVIIMQEIPYIPKALGGNPTQVPFMLLFVALVYLREITIYRRNFLFFICTVMYLAVAFGYKLAGISSAGIGNYVNPIAYFFFFIAMKSVFPRMNMQQKKFIFGLVITTMLFTMVSNWIMYMRYGFYYFSRLTQIDNIVTNAVSTQYTSAIMLMSGISLICFLHAKENRILWLIWILILNLFNILVTQRMIALILSIAMYPLIIIFNRKLKAQTVILMILLAVLLIVALENYSAVISFVSRYISSERFRLRLNQISRVLNARDIEQGVGSLSARYNLILTSLRTWLRSPRSFLLGVGDHRSTYSIIGNHSQFFDVLGQYGIIVALMLYYSVYKTMKEIFNVISLKKGTPLYRQVLVICWIFVIRGIIGFVLFGTIAIQMFIILPIAISFINEKEEISA